MDAHSSSSVEISVNNPHHTHHHSKGQEFHGLILPPVPVPRQANPSTSLPQVQSSQPQQQQQQQQQQQREHHHPQQQQQQQPHHQHHRQHSLQQHQQHHQQHHTQHHRSQDTSRRPASTAAAQAPSATTMTSSGSRGQHSSSDPYPKPSTKGGVRGRVTVVCAECKRLKLRCSRDRPCTSCTKRGCVDRCRYRNDDQPGPPMPTGATNTNANSHNSTGAMSASQIASTPSIHGEHRSSISTSHGDAPYRLVSTSCAQCASAGFKCDRREPCAQCVKAHADCLYPGLPPLSTGHGGEPSLAHALSRLARLESRLGEISGNNSSPECDSCVEANLKCDGRSPCSWCVKRNNSIVNGVNPNGSSATNASASGSETAGLPSFLHHLGSSTVSCTYSAFSDSVQRHALHSPQPSLHIGTGLGNSRDRSPYAVLRISSPPPPSSSHSTASGGGGGGTTTSREATAAELLTRIATSEAQLTNFMRGSGHGFGHQQSHSQSLHHPAHSHSLSHSSTHSITNSPFSGGNATGNANVNVSSGTVGNISSTLTPITPSHPSSLHHYMVSGGSGSAHSHSRSHSHSLSGHPYSGGNDNQSYSHQRSPSRHSPPQQHLSPSHEPGYYHTHSHAESRERDSPHQHRPRQLSTSSVVQLPRPQTSGSGRGSFSKVPTPPESSVNGNGGNGHPNATKLPEISNILTLLSPAPGSANTDSKQSPHPFPTPVSGVGSATHGILNMGLGSIQHLQSDVRGSDSGKMGFPLRKSSISGLHSLEGSRRGSTEQIGGLSGVSRELPSPSLSASPRDRLEGGSSRPGSRGSEEQKVMGDRVGSRSPHARDEERHDEDEERARLARAARRHENRKSVVMVDASELEDPPRDTKREEEEEEEDAMEVEEAEVDEIENDLD